MREVILLFAGACVLSAVFCAILIPLLKKMHAGQYILGYVQEHKAKSGTPTMGGIAFVAAAVAVAAFAGLFADRLSAVAVTFGTAFLGVGFLDDFLKFRFRRNLGLKAYQKILFQLALSVIAGVFCYLNGLTYLNIPFSDLSVDIGVWIVPLSAVVFIATVNSVNLTDGLDGLAGSAGFWYFASFALLVFLLAGGRTSLSDLSVILCGVLAGYLVFNTNKASVFMGDTGSLSLGGFAAAVGVFSGNALYIVIIGIMFVLSSISVIIQVIYYKKTKKRVFLMAPLHHHFQKKGYSEAKIAYVYSLVTALAGLLCIFFV